MLQSMGSQRVMTDRLNNNPFHFYLLPLAITSVFSVSVRVFLISHKGDDTVFVFIWLISLSIVPFGPYMLFQVPGIPSFPPLFMYLAMLGLCCCTQAFPGCSRWRATLRCGVEAHCCGFSCCGAQAPGVWALVDAASGLSSFDAWGSLS